MCSWLHAARDTVLTNICFFIVIDDTPGYGLSVAILEGMFFGVAAQFGPGYVQSKTYSVSRQARWIKIQRQGPLSFCEVEVYGGNLKKSQPYCLQELHMYKSLWFHHAWHYVYVFSHTTIHKNSFR